MKIKKIRGENFKGFKEFEFVFGQKTLVSGRNASGKTSLEDAFFFCVFGTNSEGEAKFDYKTFDKSGNPIHNLVTSVEVTMDNGGKEIVLKRAMKENWVKKRGSEEAVFQGNVGSYEVDGYPRSEKEYKEIVNGIIDANLFKVLTSPTHFVNLPWKQQREVLMSMLNESSDAELAKKIGGYEELIPELEKAPSADAIREKYAKSLKELKATQKELPVRIDEVSKQLVDVDVKALDAEKAKLDEAIAAKEAEVERLHKHGEKAVLLKGELAGIEADMKHEVALANGQTATKRAELLAELQNNRSRQSDIQMTTAREKASLASRRAQYESAVAAVENLKAQYRAESAKMFAAPKDYLTVAEKCPSCGQMLPKDRIESAKQAIKKGFEEQAASFEENKKQKLAYIAESGKAQAEMRDTIAAEIEQIKSDISDKKLLEESIAKRVVTIEAELASLPAEVTTSDSPKYKELEQRKQNILKEIAEAQVKAENAYKEEAALADLGMQMETIRMRYHDVGRNEETKQRIKQLEEEQRDTSQKVMDCEKMLYLLESFTRDKMEMVSSEINSRFEGVTFRLFELQINGGLKETCECMVDGVPYASLNNGHRIVAGLQIIKALQKVYNHNAPIFLDNAESVNDFNIPDMGDTQMILLKVTEDEKLKVEVEA